jgi:hypothetical protein
MPRSQLNATRVIVAWIIGLIPATTVDAQEPRTGVTVGVAFSTQYPDRFQEGCGNPAAVAPSVRVHHRIYRIVRAELGISGALQLPPGTHCSSGDAVALKAGDLVRQFDAPRGSLSLSTEARVVLTPMRNEDGALRLIGGAAWYPARRSPAWILGAGYRPPRSWGAFVFDIEYWRVGVPYDLERFRLDAPREFLGDGREWQGLVQVRAGITIWSN